MKKITNDFIIKISDVDESIPDNFNKQQIPMYLSSLKAMSVKSMYPNYTVIGADTLAYIDDKPVGKPKNKDEARSFLESFSGRIHKTITGISVCYNDEMISFLDIAYLEFIDIDENIIEKYINTDIPYNKAGGLAIEEVLEFNFIKNIKGSFSSVMGLPVKRLENILTTNNLL